MTLQDQDFVFYNNKEAYDGGVSHNFDSRSGAGDGDDETISVDLHAVPYDRMQIKIILSIYKGDEKGQKLSELRNTYIRIVNGDNDFELARYKMDEDLADHNETAMIAGVLNREGPKWHFKPENDFEERGLRPMAMRYGLVIMDQ